MANARPANAQRESNKAIVFYPVGLYRLVEGSVIKAWFIADEAGALLQLGALNTEIGPLSWGSLTAFLVRTTQSTNES